MTNIRGEYLFGKQPAAASSTDSYNNSALATTDSYIRNFSGGYIQFSQDIADTQHSITVKYDWYDPNTDVAGNNIGTAGATGTVKTNKADIAYSTLGIGYLYRMNNNVKFMVYYDIPIKETSTALNAAGANFTKVLAANLLTVRMQVKF